MRNVDDSASRREFIARLADIPADSLWPRISRFGSDASAVGVRKYISAMQDFHSLGLPIVADSVGGLSARALLAFGAVSGVAYGVGGKERFDASAWNKPKKAVSAFGGGQTYLLPGLDRLLKRADAELIVNAPSGRRLVSCEDRSCCPHGFEDMIRDPKGHFLRQRALACDSIAAVPDLRRVQHFLDVDLTQMDRRARLIAKLKLTDAKLASRLGENAKRVDRLRDVLGALERVSGSATRAREMVESPRSTSAAKDSR